MGTSMQQSAGGASAAINVGQIERVACGVGGLALAIMGLKSQGLGRVVLPLLGGALAYRGFTGHCSMYDALGVNTASQAEATAVPAGQGFKVERSITVARAPADVFRYWRRFEQLPTFMTHLLSVIDLGQGKSHWVAKAPLGMQVAWDAEIINERPNELIAWRSVPGSMVETAGSVHFAPSGGGTEVRVSLKYNPPGGKIGATLASWLGESPEKQITEDLQRFKQVIERERVAVGAGG